MFGGKYDGFDERMFIDLVDRDFCIRIKKAGYKIIRVNRVILFHHLGNMTSKKFIGKTIYIENHNSVRKYYKARNYIYLYKKQELSFIYSSLHIVQLIFEIVLFEEHKIDKILSVIHGFIDGFKMKRIID